jgi:Ca2+-transporting ATPase
MANHHERHLLMELLNKPWTYSKEDVLKALKVSSDKGLKAAEARQRRKEFGPNRLREAKAKSLWLILADQFKSLLTVLLGVAALLSFIFGDWAEGLAILAVIIINASIGFFTELKAVRSMEALYRLSSVSAKVRREGEIQEISASELVPGDMVMVEGGDIVTADLRLTEASKLQADESALTGESVPVSKRVKQLEGDVPLAERTNMLFKGTAVTRGSGEGVVTATGMGTELGHISSLVEEAEEERTPLEKRLDQLGHKLIWVTVGIAAIVAVTGIISGKEIILMIETGIALAVATIPEGLPIVATIALARGMLRMARRNALVNRLSAVETLGATGIICTDKTGTLTENRMTVVQIGLEIGEIEVDGGSYKEESRFRRDKKILKPSEKKVLKEALEIGVLCNNAFLKKEESIEESKDVGDPLEIALLVAGAKAGIRRDEIVKKLEEVHEEAFDPEIKMMATFHKDDGHFRVAVKGAPESVLNVCTSLRTIEGERKMEHGDRKRWLEYNDQLAGKGLRILALATKEVDRRDSSPYEDLTFLGLMGLLDPPRKDVRHAITSCKEAGIRVVMVTGDQPVTARNIGLAVGLINDKTEEVVQGKDLRNPDELSEEDRQHLLGISIFARVNPKQKLDLIEAYQQEGNIVAMTGDGVNDAPALKKADIGIAMGQRGTQVAREAADMVLKDDAFSTIIAAVEQGRIIFGNIRKFVLYLLSCNVSEVMVVSLASLVNAPLPILPLQILFLNLVTDVFPALALGVGEGDPAVMMRRPRSPKESILTNRHWLVIVGYGLTITFAVLGALALALTWFGMEKRQAVTVSFLTLAFAQLWHVFNMRDTGSGFIRNDITSNLYVWGALALCSGLLLLAVYLPGLSQVLQVTSPGRKGWLLILVMSAIPWLIGQLLKRTRVRGGAKHA